MDEIKTFSAKSVEEAVNKAMIELGIPSDSLEYEVVEKGSSGILGLFGSKPAVIKAWKKKNFLDDGEEFLQSVFNEMGLTVTVEMNYDSEEKVVNINLVGNDTGMSIGKRGQTLDSLQHLVSLVMNKNSENYVRVKLDTENYRERRKETLEMLAKNIAYKVKRTRRSVALEPMTPYERRIIHSALQDDKYCYTKSEGEEPYRHVVVFLKKDAPLPPEKKSYGSYGNRGGYGNRRYGNSRYSGSGKYHRDRDYNKNKEESSFDEPEEMKKSSFYDDSEE